MHILTRLYLQYLKLLGLTRTFHCESAIWVSNKSKVIPCVPIKLLGIPNAYHLEIWYEKLLSLKNCGVFRPTNR